MWQVPYVGSVTEAIDKVGVGQTRIVIEAPITYPRIKCFVRYGYSERCFTTLPGYYVVEWDPKTTRTTVTMDFLLTEPILTVKVEEK